MDKGKVLRLLNPVLFFSFFIQGATGIILFFEWRVPGGELVSEIHDYNGLFMIILTVFHLVFNWSWVRVNFFKKKA